MDARHKAARISLENSGVIGSLGEFIPNIIAIFMPAKVGNKFVITKFMAFLLGLRKNKTSVSSSQRTRLVRDRQRAL